MATKEIKTNFAAGELSPVMRGRIDLQEKFSGGADFLDNYIPLPQGGIIRRPGTRFLRELESGKSYRLLAYTPSSDRSFLLVFGPNTLDIYYALTVISANSSLLDVIGEPLQSFYSPYAEEELKGISATPAKTEDGDRIFVLTQGNNPPWQLVYDNSLEDPFYFEEIEFTAHPFQPADSSENTLTVSEETWVMKLISTNPTEFTGLIPGNYVEWQKDGQWVLAKILSTSTTPQAPAAPTGNVCYVQPVSNIVTGIDEKARMVVLDHVYDTEEIPYGKVHIRADTLVFNYGLEDAYIRVSSEISDIRTAAASGSSYAVGGSLHGDTLWAKVTSYLGPRDYPVEFIINPTADQLIVGNTYRILAGSTFSIYVSGPMDSGAIDWDNSFKYASIGDSFSLQNHWKFISSTGELANLSKSKSFDIVECALPITFHSCTGRVDIDEAFSEAGHLAVLSSQLPLFDFEESGGVEEGQYILAKHGAKSYLLYQVYSTESTTKATVIIRDGTLPRKTNSSNVINEGRTSDFRISAWSSGNYPVAVAWEERRLVFGGCEKSPEDIWFSRVSDVYDFRTVDSEGDSTDDAGISYPLAGKSMNRLVNLTAGPTLVIGTQSSVWQMRKSYDGEAITPANISITEETAGGCYGRAQRIGSAIIYIDLSRKYLCELGYNYEIDGFESQNINIMSGHLFEDDQIVDFCYQQRPYNLIWVFTEAGKLFSVTYNKKQGLYAWARHSTQGRILDLALLQNASSTSGYDRLVLLTDRNNGHICLELLEEFYTSSSSARGLPSAFLDCCVHGYAPIITSQPEGGLYSEGEGITLSVVASGTPILSYQWYLSGEAIEGATEATYSLASFNSSFSGSYYVVVSNNYGRAISNTVVLSGRLPEITAQPTGIEEEERDLVSVSAEVISATEISWYRRETSGEITEITPATYSGITLAQLGGRVKGASHDLSGSITDTDGIVHTYSATVELSYDLSSLTISGAARAWLHVVTSFTQSATESYFSSVRINGVPLQGGITRDFSYEVSGDIGDSVVISLETSYGQVNSWETTIGELLPSYQVIRIGEDRAMEVIITPSTAGSYYYVASNSFGSVTSNDVSIALYYSPTITRQPSDVVVELGETATLSLVAVGGSPLAYQWYQITGLDENEEPLLTEISGATATSYSFVLALDGPEADHFGEYVCKVSNRVGSVTSNAVRASNYTWLSGTTDNPLYGITKGPLTKIFAASPAVGLSRIPEGVSPSSGELTWVNTSDTGARAIAYGPDNVLYWGFSSGFVYKLSSSFERTYFANSGGNHSVNRLTVSPTGDTYASVQYSSTEGRVTKTTSSASVSTLASGISTSMLGGLCYSGGNIYVCDGTNSIFKITSAGVVSLFCTVNIGVTDIILASDGYFYATGAVSGTNLAKISSTGSVVWTRSLLSLANGLCEGTDGCLYISSSSGNIMAYRLE